MGRRHHPPVVDDGGPAGYVRVLSIGHVDLLVDLRQQFELSAVEIFMVEVSVRFSVLLLYFLNKVIK